VIEGRTELERLVSRSRLLGAAPELVVHGGGNTSTKTVEPDHAGRSREVLRVKGSGTDLAAIDPDGFPGLFLDELLLLRDRAAMTDEEMVGYLAHCMVDPAARAPSIETLLHGFLPARHVDHVHADTICALTNHPDGRRAVAEALGDDVAYVPYVRPGFALSAQVADLAGARAVVLEHHGLVTWADSHEESYELTWGLVRRASAYLNGRRSTPPSPAVGDLSEADTEELLVTLRSELVARGGPCVLHVDRRQRALADRPDADRLARDGRATPDHILRIGTHGIALHSAADVARALDAFSAGYEATFERHRARLPQDQAMLSPLPRVALVPGLGCIAAGLTPRAARIHADIALRSHTVAAMTLDAFGSLEWLTEEEAFDFDYWPMELRKLALAPPAPALSGRVVVVAPDGATGGEIGDRARGAGAAVADDVAAAVRDFGGVDAVVAPAGTREPIDHASALWSRVGSAGTVVTVAGADAEADHGAVVVAGASGAAPAVVVFALGRGPGELHGTIIRARRAA
jgi:rhamnose utilization protein RhaD (predicted bifunctional aldolase and dehydrogenase)